MKKLIEEYKKKIATKDEALEVIHKMIRDARNDSSIDVDDLREEKANCNRDRQLYIQFIEDLEGCDTVILLDYLVDNNKEFGTDSSKRRILRIEQEMFDKIVDTTKGIE